MLILLNNIFNIMKKITDIKEKFWFVIKILLWYLFYQIVCVYGFYAMNLLMTWINGAEYGNFFSESSIESAALFLSALLMIWHLVTFGYVKFSSRFFSEVSIGILMKTVMLIWGAMYVLNVVMEWIALPDFMEDTFFEIANEPLGIVSMALLAPLVEEMMFRGAIQNYFMRTSSNPWIGIIVTALIFGIVHMNPQQIVYATLLGVVFGWIYYRTRSLLPVITGHVLNNSIAVISMKIFGAEDMEAVTVDDKTVMIPFLLFIVVIVVLLAISINRELPSVPKPWRDKNI